jgi:hypothetical protein
MNAAFTAEIAYLHSQDLLRDAQARRTARQARQSGTGNSTGTGIKIRIRFPRLTVNPWHTARA